MGLVSKTVKVKWHVNNKYHYESHGYIFTRFKDEFEVRIDDLTKGTETKVRCKCDNDECGKEFSQPYNNYRKYVKEDGKTYCFECACKLYGGKNSVKTKLKNSQSFYDWCIINERKDILDTEILKKQVIQQLVWGLKLYIPQGQVFLLLELRH